MAVIIVVAVAVCVASPSAGAVWTDVDPARTGNLPFVFDADMSFEKYVDYAMDVPMYFVYRNGTYVNALGQSWRDFMEVIGFRGFGVLGLLLCGLLMVDGSAARFCLCSCSPNASYSKSSTSTNTTT